MKKRLLATLLAVCLLIGMLPMAASAAEIGTTITTATLHDTRTTGNIPDNQLCTNYTVGTTEDSINNVTVITVSGTALQKHQNANNDMGYWAGVCLQPNDTTTAKKMKYAVSFTKDTAVANFNSATASEFRYGIGFIQYLDLGAYKAQALKDGFWIKLQWLDGSGNAIADTSAKLYNVKFAESLIPVYGTAAQDPGNTGGSGCTVAVNDDDPANVKVNVTGAVEWYPASQSPTRQAGNMVGVIITPPTGFDTSNSTFTWKSYTNASWDANKDQGADTLTFYSALTSENKTDTLTVKWKEGNEQTFTVDASGATLKGEWPTLTIPTGLPTGCSITDVKSKHADRNEMDVTNENNFVQPGAVVTMTLTAGSGYHVKDAVTVNVAGKTAVTAAGSGSTYTFTVPADAAADNDLTLENPFEADEEPGPDAPVYGAVAKASGNVGGTYEITGSESAATTVTITGDVAWQTTDTSPMEGEDGNIVGVTVTPPAGFNAATTTVAWGNGNPAWNTLHPATTTNAVNFYFVLGDGHMSNSFTITWDGDNNKVQTITVNASGATLEDEPTTPTPDDPNPPTPVDPTPVDPTPVDPAPSDEPVVETNTAADGTVTTTTTWNDGKEAVAVKTPEGDTEITVTAPSGEAVAKVEIPAEPGESKDFEDVRTGAWYETAVNSATGYGLFNGTTETKFSPDTPMTRGMLAAVLHNLSGKPAYGTGAGTFTDVKDGAWYEDPIDWAYKVGVTSGTGANRFSPNNNITREQLVTMLYNYAKAIGATSKNRTGLTSFPDGGSVAGYAQDAMQWAVAEGFISGRANGGRNYIAPKGTATRAEVAVVLTKFVEYLK